jgi:hypothetical protein
MGNFVPGMSSKKTMRPDVAVEPHCSSENVPPTRAGAMHCFDLVYPKEEERAWDAVATRISLSLRPLEG